MVGVRRSARLQHSESQRADYVVASLCKMICYKMLYVFELFIDYVLFVTRH